MNTPSKVKELDDEDYSYQAMQEPLYRVETGNYEYRLIEFHTGNYEYRLLGPPQGVQSIIIQGVGS